MNLTSTSMIAWRRTAIVALDLLLIPLFLSVFGLLAHMPTLHLLASWALVPGILLLVVCSFKLGPAIKAMQLNALSEQTRLRMIIDSSADAVAILDSGGRVVVANSAMERLHGSPDAATFDTVWSRASDLIEIARPDGALLPAKEWPRNRLQRGESIVDVPIRFRRSGGKLWRDLLVTGRRVPRAGGSTDEFVLIMRDLTQMRIVEDQLRTSQRVEIVGQLASGMAHDFNNLLTVIMASAESVQHRLPPDDPMHEEFRHLLDAADHGAELAGRVLALTQNRSLAQSLFPVSEVVARIDPLARRLLPATIAIEIRNATEASDAMFIDEGSIEQILLNLFTNARDAMPGVGRLQVDISVVVLNEASCHRYPDLVLGPHICVRVSDTGFGMSPETARRAFEPFFTTKTATTGTGLGLAMVHRLVTAQGGGISLSSTPDVGTTVEMFFPRKVVTPVHGSIMRVPETRERAATILLAEDNDAVARATTAALEGRGHKVIRAVDGIAALDAFRRHLNDIELVVSDLEMPRMSGETLLGFVRMEQPSVPIVCLTASATLRETSERLGGRLVRFVPKPWKREDLLAVVDLMLQLRRNHPRAPATAL